MRKISAALLAALALGAGPAARAASNFNPAGIYIGAAVGESNIRSNGYSYNNYYGFNDRNTAWQLTVGMRPISIVGAEFDYIDFGSPGSSGGVFSSSANSDTRAEALFAVGYLPLPLPFLDIYGKLGFAHLQSDFTVLGPNSVFRQSLSDNDLAYGAGLQVNFGNIGVRADYERIDASGGNPDILSLGVVWTF